LSESAAKRHLETNEGLSNLPSGSQSQRGVVKNARASIKRSKKKQVQKWGKKNNSKKIKGCSDAAAGSQETCKNGAQVN